MRARILIVEDESIVGADLSARLKAYGHEVIGVAASGEAAVELAAAACPDLVLMDIALSASFDGIEAARIIRRETGVPIVYLTGHLDESKLERLRQTEPFGFIFKPIKDIELYYTVETAIQRRELETRLRASEEKYRDLVESFHDAIFSTDEAGMLTYVSPAFGDIFETSPPEAIGRPLADYFYESDLSAIMGSPDRDKWSDKAVDLQAKIPGGTKRWVRVQTGMFRGRDGHRGLSGLITDVTERIRESAALIESNERYRALFDRSFDAVFLHDFDGIITDANVVAQTMLGMKREALVGAVFFDFLDPGHAELARSITSNLRLTHMPREPEEMRIMPPGRTPLWVEAQSSVIMRNGAPHAVQAIVRDIGKRKEAESRMASSLREKVVLLDEIHHRVKNNLQIISSLLDMTSMRITDSKSIGLIEDVRSKIYTMAIIHNFLYRSERFDRVDMHNCVLEIMTYLSRLYNRPDVRLTAGRFSLFLTIEKAVPFALAINEIVSNAYKYAFDGIEGGEIGVNVGVIAEGAIRMTVRDNGIGIPGGMEIDTMHSMGFKLVRNLVRDQLKGKLSVIRDGGTSVIIEFMP
ncbi:MAG TPA: PAS domain S-box protein [Spirochaetota bacterium]|nr:MAG: putative sensor histidine kinase pdtaS [Spirochaetes bacterium ADurb.BinA120]HNU91840.1 PAS domain S-box protein [Spirochaetota bacterium]